MTRIWNKITLYVMWNIFIFRRYVAETLGSTHMATKLKQFHIIYDPWNCELSSCMFPTLVKWKPGAKSLKPIKLLWFILNCCSKDLKNSTGGAIVHLLLFTSYLPFLHLPPKIDFKCVCKCISTLSIIADLQQGMWQVCLF